MDLWIDNIFKIVLLRISKVETETKQVKRMFSCMFWLSVSA